VSSPVERAPSFSIEVDGDVVGPRFDYGDEEDAHSWVATHHPNRPYTILCHLDGEQRRVDYLPETLSRG
jgi:hypothetical protein